MTGQGSAYGTEPLRPGGSDGERQEDDDVLGESFRDAVHAAETGAVIENHGDRMIHAVKVSVPNR